MKFFIYFIPFTVCSLLCSAQYVHQIKADSVRIYSACDTAELIIENHTQRVPGFLFNKGRGRTEFQRLRLINAGNNSIAIPGQDTLNLGNVMTSWGDGRYDLLATNFVTIPYNDSMLWEQWPANKAVGYDAYMGTDMPALSAQAFQGVGNTTYYNGLVVRDGNTGFDFAVNWDGELLGPNGAFLRTKDDTKTKWSKWRELLFKDYADNNYIRSQKLAAQTANLWISGMARIGDSVVLAKYRNNTAGDSILSTDANGRLLLKRLSLIDFNGAPATGSNAYVQNSPSQAQIGSFWLTGNGTLGGGFASGGGAAIGGDLLVGGPLGGIGPARGHKLNMYVGTPATLGAMVWTDELGTQTAGLTMSDDGIINFFGTKVLMAMPIQSTAGLQIKENSVSARMGLATLADGVSSVTVNTSVVTANSRIFLTVQSGQGNFGSGPSSQFPLIANIGTVSPGSSFTIVANHSLAGLGVAKIAWMIVEPF